MAGAIPFFCCYTYRKTEAGRLAPHFTAQREWLLEEGVTFKDRNHVDMKECQWDC